MTDKKPLNIVVVTDEHYVILLAALINSIEANIRAGQKINIYIVEDKVSNTSKKKLQQSVNEKTTNLIWKKMSDILDSGIRLPLDRSSFPLNVYMRLFIPYYIPAEIEKVLFMDVDMIVQNDISLIFDYDISDYAIGAVQDPRLLTFDNSWGGILNYKELGLNPKSKYFNAGLYLINTRKWIEDNITEKVINCIDNNIKYAFYPDQYGLNVVLADKWLEMDPLWNHFCTVDHPAPFLIHYVQRKPIYKSYNNSEEYKKIFYNYLSKTKWKNFKPIGESTRYIKKIKNVLNKFLKWK